MNLKQAHYRDRDIRAVLFDLDGTLIDTLADITIALNQALDEHGCRAVPQEKVRELIGRGPAILIERALQWNQQALAEAGRSALLDRFLYHSMRLHTLEKSRARPYPDAAQTLTALTAHHLKLGVVTNKQHRLALGALAHAGLLADVPVVVGGDSCRHRKPDPEPLLHACRLMQVAPIETLMVGDSKNDVSAARAAGVAVVCVPYGYNEGEDPRSLPCDDFIESLAELPRLLGLRD